MVYNRDEQIRIMRAIHCGIGETLGAQALGGHLGINNCIARMRPRYHWLNMNLDVGVFVATCEECQQNKLVGTLKAPHTLHPVAIPYGKPWSQIGMDLIGPLKPTANGNEYVLSRVCYFTKMCRLTAIPDKEAITIANILYSDSCFLGPPAIHISDQGREFCNQVSTVLTTAFGTAHKITSAYHPQSNGLCKQLNRDTVGCLRKMVESARIEERWDEAVDAIQFSHNTMIKRMTG